MNNKTIATIKRLFATEQLNDSLIKSLRLDERKGVQQLLKTYDNQQRKIVELEKEYLDMSFYEQKNYEKGNKYIAGIDEAGRGPLAGPVVAASVILPEEFKLLGLTDSKKLSEAIRNQFFKKITAEAISYSVSIVDNQVIDQINIYEATKLAMKESLTKLTTKPNHVLIDAVPLQDLPYTSEVIIKGDEKSVSIAAASILAKVTRDQIMEKIDQEHPEYHFSKNNGYGTKHHLTMLKKHGITTYHRKSYSPVKQLLD